MKKGKIKKVSFFAVVFSALFFAAGCFTPVSVTDRMDVQKLWKEATGMEDYPQAAVAVNAEFALKHGSFLKAFVAAVKECDDWAENNPDKAALTVARSVEQGMTTSVVDITADVVRRCHVKAIDAVESKTAIENYLRLFVELETELGESPIGGKLPDDAFYFIPTDGGIVPEKVRIFVPDGATALALAFFMNEPQTVGGAKLEITVVSPTKIGGIAASGSADIAVLPSNAAAKLYNASGKYKLLMTLTHGNLYVVGGDMSGVSDLVGKRVGVIVRGQVPDLVLRYILKKKGIEYAFSDVAIEGKVALTYFENSGAVAQALKAGKVDFGLLAEPVASAVYDKIKE